MADLSENIKYGDGSLLLESYYEKQIEYECPHKKKVANWDKKKKIFEKYNGYLLNTFFCFRDSSWLYINLCDWKMHLILLY